MTTDDRSGTTPPDDETPEQRALREQMEAVEAQRRAAEAAMAEPVVPTPGQVAAVVERLKAMVPLGAISLVPADELLINLAPDDFKVLVAHGYHDELGLPRIESEIRKFLRNDRHYSTAQAEKFKMTLVREAVNRLINQHRPRNRNGRGNAPPPRLAASTERDNSPFLAPGSYTPQTLVDALKPNYVLSRLASKSVVIERLGDGTLRYFTYKEFEDHYIDVKVLIPMQGGMAIEKDGPRWWFESGKGRVYRQGVDCVPRKLLGPHVLNTWRGFGPKLEGFTGYALPDDLKALIAEGKGSRGSATMPRPKGTWRKFRQLVRDIICNGDEGLYQFTLNWLAYMVQHPNEPGHTFLVLTGEEGVGKGVFGDVFTELLGKAHGYYVSSGEALTGDYNDHLQDKVALFADEAVFSGSHKIDNILKALVTQDVINIHRKFFSRYMVRNLLHIVVATNSLWAIRVSATARRPVVYKVSDRQINNTDYFAPIQREMHQEGGLAAMLFDLLVRDISKFNVRQIYRTAAMSEQREFSFEPHEAWLEEVLERGYVYESAFGLDAFRYWRDVVPRVLLYASYKSFYRRHSRRATAAFSQRRLTTWLIELGFKDKNAEGNQVKAGRSDPAGERKLPNSMNGDVVTAIQAGRRAIDFGTQAEARAVFDRKIRRVPTSKSLWASELAYRADRPVREDGQTEADLRPPERPNPPDDEGYDGVPEA